MNVMRRIVPGILLSSFPLAGCVSPANDRLTIGESIHLESLSPQPQPPPPSPTEQLVSPSLAGISRVNWAPTPILLPVDGTDHYPIFARRTTWADKTARQRNLNPTAASALDLYNGSETEQDYEALNNQLRAIEDVILLIPRAIGYRPWRLRRSPDEAYQRYWRPER